MQKVEWETAPLLYCLQVVIWWKNCIYHDIIGVFDKNANLNFQAYGELESKRLYDV